MKNHKSNKIVFGLFVLLFVTVDVGANVILSNFTYREQGGGLTCWAACLRMVMEYYDVVKDEDRNNLEIDIRRLAFNTPDTEPAPNRTNDLGPVANLLIRLLLTSGNRSGNSSLTRNDVRALLNSGVPIIAGTRRFDHNGTLITNIPGHMYVIVGYRDNDDDMILHLADPLDPLTLNTFYNREYSLFAEEGTNQDGTIERWVASMFPTNLPPHPKTKKNIVVDQISVPTKTITDAIARTVSNSINPLEFINIWDDSVYDEQVTIDSTKSNINIMSSSPSPTNPLIRSPRALRVLDAQGIGVIGVDIDGIDGIDGNEAIYNTGTLTLMHLNVSAESGPLIYNDGTLYIDHNQIYNRVMVSATSDDAIHNTGAVFILNGTVSAASGYTAINNSGAVYLYGTTELRTASGNSDTIIYNYGPNGTLILGNTPSITGHIAGFGAGRTGVQTSGTYRFNPGNNRYTLAPANLKNGDIVVVGGANFNNNFELVDTNFILDTIGNHLVAISTAGSIAVNKAGAYETVTEALAHARPGQEIIIIDSAAYEEQVTINDTLPSITIRSRDSTFSSLPRLVFFRTRLNYPLRNHTAFNLPSGTSATIDDIEDNSAVRIFAHGVLIDSIDIEGENAVYNTGDAAIRNGTVSATSYYAIYNTGTMEITNATLSTESGYAVYNTGTLYITNATISEASDYAIYNYGSDGRLILAGTSNITGRIAGFGTGQVSVITTNPNSFMPGNRRYLLAPSNLNDGDVVVVGGAGFRGNFELANAGFALVVAGNDLIAHNIFGTPAAIDTVYSQGLTLASLTLPAGYAWVSPGTVLYAGDNQVFDAVYTDPDGIYEPTQGEITVSVAKAEYDMSGIAFRDTTVLYNGEAQSIFITGTLPQGVTVLYDGNEQTEMGTYTVTVNFIVADTNYIVPQSMSAELTIAVTNSVQSTNRVIIQDEPHGETSDIFSVNITRDKFSAGPVPVSKQAGSVNFFWQGRSIRNGALHIYGSTGNLVKKINISDKAHGNQERRKVGEWDLTCSNRRPVSEGSYVVRGTITAKDGTTKKISVILNVM
jgi:hypothetical protein